MNLQEPKLHSLDHINVELLAKFRKNPLRVNMRLERHDILITCPYTQKRSLLVYCLMLH
jgi:hypothetical protein